MELKLLHLKREDYQDIYNAIVGSPDPVSALRIYIEEAIKQGRLDALVIRNFVEESDKD